jgi:hypothetical protein
MKDIVIVCLVAITAFLVWNQPDPTSFENAETQPVSPDIIQVIIEAIQKEEPDLEPLETLFIEPKMDRTGTLVYNARMMFMNTRGFFGVQYDIVARVGSDGEVRLVSKIGSAHIDREGPFKSFIRDKFMPYKEIDDNLDRQLKEMLTESRNKPVLVDQVRAYAPR